MTNYGYFVVYDIEGTAQLDGHYEAGPYLSPSEAEDHKRDIAGYLYIKNVEVKFKLIQTKGENNA